VKIRPKWCRRRGVPIWQAASFLGMSSQPFEPTYGHHNPDDMRGAAQAITRDGKLEAV
jgi:hypothetical protein